MTNNFYHNHGEKVKKLVSGIWLYKLKIYACSKILMLSFMQHVILRKDHLKVKEDRGMKRIELASE